MLTVEKVRDGKRERDKYINKRKDRRRQKERQKERGNKKKGKRITIWREKKKLK